MFDHRHLPPELWLEILGWAIQPIERERYRHTIDYVPFQRLPAENRDPTFSTTRSLTMVCRVWRIWMIHHLYRDIRIQHGVHALEYTFKNHDNYGQMVHRAVLPYPSTTSSPRSPPTSTAIEILQYCSRLEILTRPRYLIPEVPRFEFEVDCVPLPSLRRLEWWHYPEAERSGGINSLRVVLRHAPKVEYLFVGGVLGYAQYPQVSLPFLRTLRLHAINGILSHHIVSTWELPSMTHIIFDSPLVEPLQNVWDKFGQQLQVVEFGKHLRFIMNDYLTACLRGCQRLQEIGYHIFFTKVPQAGEIHTSIVTVRVHSAVNSFLDNVEEVWAYLEGHFNFFLEQLTSLQRIFLHGEWKGILRQRRFHRILERVQRHSLLLEWADDN